MDNDIFIDTLTKAVEEARLGGYKIPSNPPPLDKPEIKFVAESLDQHFNELDNLVKLADLRSVLSQGPKCLSREQIKPIADILKVEFAAIRFSVEMISEEPSTAGYEEVVGAINKRLSRRLSINLEELQETTDRFIALATPMTAKILGDIQHLLTKYEPTINALIQTDESVLVKAQAGDTDPNMRRVSLSETNLATLVSETFIEFGSTDEENQGFNSALRNLLESVNNVQLAALTKTDELSTFAKFIGPQLKGIVPIKLKDLCIGLKKHLQLSILLESVLDYLKTIPQLVAASTKVKGDLFEQLRTIQELQYQLGIVGYLWGLEQTVSCLEAVVARVQALNYEND